MNDHVIETAIIACAVACMAALSAEHRELASRHPDYIFAADMAESASKWSARAFDWSSELKRPGTLGGAL